MHMAELINLNSLNFLMMKENKRLKIFNIKGLRILR